MERWEIAGKNNEFSSKDENKKDSKPAKLKELLKRIGRPLAEGIAVGATAVALTLSAACTTEFRTNEDSTEEVDGIEDSVEADHMDVLEIEDAPDISEDVESEDLTGEEPVECEPVDGELSTTIDVDTSVIVGNIEVEYSGIDTGGDGIYRILCDGSVVDTLNIAEGADGFSSLPGRGGVQIHVNTVRSWGSNVVITVSAL